MLILVPHPTCKVYCCLKFRGCQIYHIQPISASNTQPAVAPAGTHTETYGKNRGTGIPWVLDHVWRDGMTTEGAM